MPDGPLAALRVVDLTDLRGALAARLLADLGADVLRVEPPEVSGEVARGAAWLYRNANKRGAGVDLRRPDARARFEALCAEADVLIENLGPERASRLDLAPEAVARRHPHLLHVAVSDFGRSGPRAGWWLEPLPAFAASGALFASGFPDRPPCWLPGHLAHDCASVFAALGALAAAMARARGGGPGEWIEVSVQEAAIHGLNPWAIPLADYARSFPLLPANPPRAADGIYLVLPAQDGFVRVVIGNPAHWRAFLELLEQPEVLQGPQWESHIHRLLNADAIRLVARERFADRTRADLFEAARRVGVPLGALHRPSEFVEAEQTRARGYFLRTGFPELGDAPVAGPCWRLSRTPAALRRPAPVPGQASAEGFRPRPAQPPPRTRRSDGQLLLDGVRVVEFGVAAVVPELCWALSELGAEVVKVESRAKLDVLRLGTIDGNPDHSWTFNDECRGRRSVCLDLTTQRGRELALELCARADVVAENNRGGVMEALGLGYEAVRARNPAVVYASSQGYGCDGPLAAMPSFGPLNLGFAGQHLLWNHEDAPYPCGTTLAHPDHIAGKLLAIAVLAALDHRDRTGEGQRVELAQTEAAAYLVGEHYLAGPLFGEEPRARGNRSETAVPHDVYPCAGDDRWCAIAAPDDAAFERLRACLGWPGDPALATLAGRLARRAEIDARLSAWTRERSPEAAAAALQAAGVSAMPVQGPDDHRADPHLAARGAIYAVVHEDLGSERHIANPLRFGRTPLRAAGPAPRLGADTEAVLGSILGLSALEVARLVEAGVCR